MLKKSLKKAIISWWRWRESNPRVKSKAVRSTVIVCLELLGNQDKRRTENPEGLSQKFRFNGWRPNPLDYHKLSSQAHGRLQRKRRHPKIVG